MHRTNTMATFNISIEKLDAAILSVIDAGVADHVKNHVSFYRRNLHDMAIRQAFVYGASADDEFVLKAAATVIDKHGFYKLDDGHE
jgi:hypothetical protein